MNSEEVRLHSVLASNFTALAHHLTLLPESAATGPWQDSLRTLAQLFNDAHPDSHLEIINIDAPPQRLRYVFHCVTPDETHVHPHLTHELRSRLVHERHLWHTLEYGQVSLRAFNSSAEKGCVTILLAEVALDDSPGLDLQVAAMSRPLPGLRANGDGFWYQVTQQGVLACVVDGLGHGEQAEYARRIAIDCVREHQGSGLETIFAQVHRALKKSRGAAMSMVRIGTSENLVEHAGVGNVALRLAPGKSKFYPRAGILGVGSWAPLRVTRSAWQPDSMLVLFTDGLHGHWFLPDPHSFPASLLCHLLLHSQARDNDDATALVVSGSAR